MGLISLEGMEFYAYHGCFEEEKVIGTKFMVDLYLETPTQKAEKSDDLTKTVNYQEVYRLVREEMNRTSNLLEHVARRILNSIKDEFPAVESADVKIYKMNPPLGGKMKSVSVSLSTDEE